MGKKEQSKFLYAWLYLFSCCTVTVAYSYKAGVSSTILFPCIGVLWTKRELTLLEVLVLAHLNPTLCILLDELEWVKLSFHSLITNDKWIITNKLKPFHYTIWSFVHTILLSKISRPSNPCKMSWYLYSKKSIVYWTGIFRELKNVQIFQHKGGRFCNFIVFP